ncbi:MAG: glycosyltransferase family 4 protein [Anaerolineales bacterium]|jgi:glycosyltransferase involved in cell wall biosynthesis
MQILQVHPFLRGEGINPAAGGKSRVSRSLTQFLGQQGVKVALYPFGEGILGEQIPAPWGDDFVAPVFPTLSFPDRRSFLHLLRTAWSLRRKMCRHPGMQETVFSLASLRNVLNEFRPDLVHNHFARSDFVLFLRATSPRLPVVLTHHTGAKGFHLELYDHIIFLSQWMQEQFAPVGSALRSQSSVVYYPVEDIFREGAIVPSRDRQAVVFVGRPTRAKGLDVLIEAWRNEPKLQQLPIRVCGSSEEEATDSRWTREKGIDLRFEGRLSPHQLMEVLSHSILMVNPSRLEGFSVAVLEALCCGTPVIGWAPQIAEIQSRWGFEVGVPFDARAQSSGDLARSVLAVLEGNLRSTERSAAIAEHARQDFSVERYGRENQTIYQSVLGLHS